MSTNSYKHLALNHLLNETFSHIHQQQYKQYTALAQTNSQIQKTHVKNVQFFMYNGIIYPPRTKGGLSVTSQVTVFAPPLHPTLNKKFETIQEMDKAAGYNSIRNFFISVLNASCNNIVLDKFIPSILLTSLQKRLGEEEFKILNYGVFMLDEPIETTKGNIKKIEEHYADSIVLFRELLIQQFLLQE